MRLLIKSKKIIGATIMKIALHILLIFVIGLLSKLNAQTKEDSLAIKKVALDYIEGYFYKDGERMKNALHPELVKRTIRKDTDGKCYLINLGASFMRYATVNNQNLDLMNPEKKMVAEVIIFDIFQNVASVKITNNQYQFIDYLHIGKFDGEWKIINVLWENILKDK